MQVTRELEIDVSREHRNWTTMAKQYDINSRFLQVRLMNDGEPISVGENTYVVFKVQRIDGQFKSFRGSVCPDGAVRVPLSAWALKVGEHIRCEIIIIDAETEKQLLTSGQFKIEVEPSISTGDEVADDGNYDILVSLIADVDGAVTKAKEAAEAANTAKAGADAAANEARDAAKAAELSKSAADEAAKTAYNAADAANTAKSAADTATESANSAAEAANSAAERANDAAQKAESATVASEQATEAAKKATSEATASADKAEQAADAANAAKSEADTATEAAKRATEGANASKADADAAAERANKSADAADAATDNAGRAADSASKAADAANTAKTAADTAAQSANEAADAANASKSAADIATNRANDAAQAASTAAGTANDAAAAANMAAGSVGNAVTAARDAAANANEIAGIASDAADTANAAAENADEAASNANAAAEAANVAKQGADTAAENANNAASAADTAASSADAAARSANDAADAANASKQAADVAADNANRAAVSANKWSKVSASIEMLDPSASPSVSVTDSADGTGKDMKFSVPTGKTGATPNITIGKVNTVPAGTPAAVRRSGTDEKPVLDFDVPEGDAGSEVNILHQINDRIYQGTDLTVKFASEIAASPYNGDPWAWIQARIKAGNFDGIHVCDYIPFTATNGVKLQAQVAGINTYKNYGDTAVGNHIDFITREIWPTLHPMNKVNYNNGGASQTSPWLASDGYHWLNSLAGQVPNGVEHNPEMTEVDYTSDGVYSYLPQELKNVIVEKRMLIETRYSESGLMTESNGSKWDNVGKLWLPTETEILGAPCFGGHGYAQAGSTQYPIFAQNMNRLRYRNGSRYFWRTSTPRSGSSSSWCDVGNDGTIIIHTASDTSLGTPVCFRIS